MCWILLSRTTFSKRVNPFEEEIIMGVLIGQPLKEVELGRFEPGANLIIKSLRFYDPITHEDCKYVASLDNKNRPYIKLIRDKVVPKIISGEVV